MTSWNPQANDLFLKALERSAGVERQKFLDAACGGNTPLRAEVEGLLEANAQAGEFLEPPHGRPVATVEDQPLSEQPGTMIGQYKLLEQVGEGGFGVVFLAEQTAPVRRKVALKILKAGMDTRQVVARFEAERQALAIMDHPNIAKVLDGGATTSGRPYLVMELVKGVPITRFCGEHKLTPRQRLELFVQVCQAVQHAHQKGIIHRDLKPSNILVMVHDTTPVPKVIDFGVAKALAQELTDKTLFTGFAQVIGTPLYMSPEQAGQSGLDIDTRSDVYSLGVLLYELLTGTTPFEKERFKQAGHDEICRIIREEEPPKPSTRVSTFGRAATTNGAARRGEARKLKQLLRGELDWVVMKCLEKDRNRRYETANALAQDVQRYLRDEPVLARPPSAAYKFRKFARRNRAGLAAAALVGGLLLTAVAVLAVSAVRIAQEEQAKSEALVKERQATQDKEGALKDMTLAHEKLRKSLYRHDVALAHREWLAGNLGRAEQLLNEECPADLRRWEWHYLKRLCRQEAFTLPARAYPGFCLAFSPDGTRLAFFDDQTVRVWDATAARELLALRGHGQMGDAVAFSPDGRNLASASRDGVVKVWDVTTGREVRTLLGHQGVVRGVAYSPDGRRLVTSGRDSTVRVWDLATGQEVFTLRGHQGDVICVAYSPDGQRLVSTTLTMGTVKVWDAQTGKEVLALPGGAAVAVGKAVDREGPLVASRGEDWSEVNVWDGTTGTKLRVLRGHASAVNGLAFSADGRFLATASGDLTVKVWDLTTGLEYRTLRGHNREVSSVAFSSDGQKLASLAGDGTIKIWNLGADQEARTFRWSQDHGINDVAFGPDGRCLVLVGRLGTRQVWDVAAGRELLTLGPVLLGYCDFSCDGRRVAWISPDRTVTVCEVSAGREVFTRPGPVTGGFRPTLSADGRRLAVEGMDQILRVWDVNSGLELLAVPHAKVASRVALSPDGRLFAFRLEAESTRVWDLETGRVVRTFPQPPGPVGHLQFSPDGRRLAWASPTNTIEVTDLTTGQQVFILGGHHRAVHLLAFSPDGDRLASASADGTMRVWELETGHEVLTLRGHAHTITALTFSPDGHRLASAARDMAVRIWDATPLEEPAREIGNRAPDETP